MNVKDTTESRDAKLPSATCVAEVVGKTIAACLAAAGVETLDNLEQMCMVWSVETMELFLVDDAKLNVYQVEHTKHMGIRKLPVCFRSPPHANHNTSRLA